MAIQPITGKESYWGDVKPTDRQVSLINLSPTLQGDLNDYGKAVAAGEVKPFTIGQDDGSYFDRGNQQRIVLGHDFVNMDDNNWIGGLSHELGHFENRQTDEAMAARYSIAARDPEAYDTQAMIGMRGEGEALYNNWKVEHEILDHTAGNGQPGTRIGIYGDWRNGTIERTLQSTHEADVQSGQSDEQDRNRLIDKAAGFNALQRPSDQPSSTYFEYYGGGDKNVVPPGLGSPTAVQLNDPAGDGKITSMNETYASGMRGTQNFGPDGKLTSADITDANGNVQRRIGYARQIDGAYTATIYNGQGGVTERDAFDKGGASVAYTFNRDGTQTAQAYDASGAPKGEAVASSSPPAVAALPESTQTAQAYGSAEASDAGESA
ncbi:hypothetical protein QCE63_30650 [Caballeronia sp. LZ065]|uniref:hypothetical protein n=1 Tax=Caballeronia sp. LZ065 TaxID=3038571 RepID=UPI002858D2D7|nr:hypothetical protein [Caballeronia sp. LZ065]MDR5783780.1 hypothetical protein [Caballeronia sp. LZ065]